MKSLKNVVWHPYLFAIYSILFMYAHNIKEVRFVNTLFPVLILLIFVFAGLSGLNLMVKDRLKAALIMTLFLFFFFGYSHVFNLLEIVNFMLDAEIIRDLYLVPIFLGLWFYIAYRIARAKMDFKAVTKILTIVVICLIAINLVNIGLFEMNRLSAAKEVTAQLKDLEIKSSGLPAKDQMPDIYHIVLDEYAGLEAIKKIYDYDNSGFAEELRKRGFFVAEKSETLYLMTESSIASALNMRKLRKGEDAYQLIRNNRVTAILKKLGYKIILFPFNRQTIFLHADMGKRDIHQ